MREEPNSDEIKAAQLKKLGDIYGKFMFLMGFEHIHRSPSIFPTEFQHQTARVLVQLSVPALPGITPYPSRIDLRVIAAATEADTHCDNVRPSDSPLDSRVLQCRIASLEAIRMAQNSPAAKLYEQIELQGVVTQESCRIGPTSSPVTFHLHSPERDCYKERQRLFSLCETAADFLNRELEEVTAAPTPPSLLDRIFRGPASK